MRVEAMMGRVMMRRMEKQRVERRMKFEWGREEEGKLQGENPHDMQDQAE